MEESAPGHSGTVSYNWLYQQWRAVKHLSQEIAVDHIASALPEPTTGILDDKKVRRDLIKFVKNVGARWTQSKSLSSFKYRNKSWLNKTYHIPMMAVETSARLGRSGGRPRKLFEECGIKSKLSKIQDLMDRSTEELSFATRTKLNAAGKRSAATVVQTISNTTPRRARKYKLAISSGGRSQKKYRHSKISDDAALSLLIDAKLSKRQYLLIRESAKQNGTHIFPSWGNILSAKRKCYPLDDALILTETSAEVALQNMLDVTALRLYDFQKPVFEKILNEDDLHFTLISKWGCDGSSGQNIFKQSFSEEGKPDASVFMMAFVPLQLICSQFSDSKRIIIWQNPAPCSSRFCRPFKYIFSKDSDELVKQEVETVKQQISRLSPTKCSDSVAIHHSLSLTMVDGKVINTLTDTKSTQSCFVCKAKPSEMNDLDQITKKTPITDNLHFGLSPLHARIRFMECCLHVAYRLDFKQFQARGENKKLLENRKKQVIHDLRQQLGLLVDQPKPGFGSTNDGNSARTFFRDPSLTSSITGLSEEVLKRFSIILTTLTCGFDIDADRFQEYEFETAKIFLEHYGWYTMPPTLHKILIHGGDAIRHTSIPIGQLSEEAQESLNHQFKFIRQFRTRKNSRLNTNEDLFNYLILYSDPILSQINRRYLSPKKQLTPEVIGLLKEPQLSAERDLGWELPSEHRNFSSAEECCDSES